MGAGVSDAPLSSGGGGACGSGLFVTPHAADDPVCEVAFVGSACFAAGLGVGGLAVDVGASVLAVALLGDGGDVEHTVDTPVATEVEPMFDRLAVAFSGGEGDSSGAAPACEFGFGGEPERIADFTDQGGGSHAGLDGLGR